MAVVTSKHSLVTKALGFIVALVFFSFAGMIGFWVKDRDEPVVINSAVVQTARPEPGDTVKVLVDLYRRRSCPFRVTRHLFDSAGSKYSLKGDEDPIGIDPPGPHKILVPIELPDGVTIGLAHYRYSILYYCNPLQKLWPIVVKGGYNIPIFSSTKLPATTQSKEN